MKKLLGKIMLAAFFVCSISISYNLKAEAADVWVYSYSDFDTYIITETIYHGDGKYNGKVKRVWNNGDVTTGMVYFRQVYKNGAATWYFGTRREYIDSIVKKNSWGEAVLTGMMEYGPQGTSR